ncbi:hypothetical protein BO94DRAFT_548439 [Aspergillus sclerotioniger CBS 115572]|uniref:Uncharacterized protein n=1 Tax=Aspergillus sclerotioniger CBS 115572 TaxID=1450535 RepID=A0A317W560_9EURO|nr:hypothetical protein BO94DRAFT_548439 [Aspergillus sclerotioniger CBS 115572]PWY80462.1 hypothetical protein BO94DRAFT_548439 [Aspergillus sclerotioniger CBS 115572]
MSGGLFTETRPFQDLYLGSPIRLPSLSYMETVGADHLATGYPQDRGGCNLTLRRNLMSITTCRLCSTENRTRVSSGKPIARASRSSVITANMRQMSHQVVEEALWQSDGNISLIRTNFVEVDILIIHCIWALESFVEQLSRPLNGHSTEGTGDLTTVVRIQPILTRITWHHRSFCKLLPAWRTEKRMNISIQEICWSG